MDIQLRRRIQDQALPLLDSHPDTKVVVWGAGEIGSWLMAELGPRGVAFVDANPTKHGESIANRPVYQPKDLASLSFDEVWIAVLSDAEAVAEQLRAAGLSEGSGFRRPFPGGKREQVVDQLPRLFEFLGQANLEGSELLEVGFGGQLFLALACLWRGARTVTLTDVSAQASPLERDPSPWLEFLGVLEADFSQQCLTDRSFGEILASLTFQTDPLSASQLPFPAGSFDGLINTGVMEHLDDPDGAIADFARVLRPGGQVLAAAIGIHDHRANDPASAFHPWSFLSSTTAEWEALGAGAYHQNRWRSVDFKRAFQRHGFELVHSSSQLDSRFDPRFVDSFAPEFQDAYSLDEFAELDLYLIARKQS